MGRGTLESRDWCRRWSKVCYLEIGNGFGLSSARDGVQGVLADGVLMSIFLRVLGHGGFGLGTSRYRGRV